MVALFDQDERFRDISDDGEWLNFNGPWIGLVQDPKGREPGGGWQWVTGEPLGYTHWWEGQPNENTRGSDVGRFYAAVRSGSDRKLAPNAWDDNPGDDADGFIMELE